MGKVYEHKNLAIKWCLQRVFKDVDIGLSSQAYPEPAFCREPTLYYGFSREARIATFEEYIPVPFNLFKIFKFAGNEAKKKEKYLLKPLSKELYDKLRKLYPHRHERSSKESVNYEKILSVNKGSLLNEFKEKKYKDIPDTLDYQKWEEKILQYVRSKRWEDAIFLLNHLFMGNVDDPPEKIQQEFNDRYYDEFNIKKISTRKILVVDDFFFLHIYQFSLLERYHANYDETKSVLFPEIHFEFECIAKDAIEKIKTDGDKYALILLDIDFGQQQKTGEDVAEIANSQKIPFCNFSKFKDQDEYDPFHYLYPLKRIKKDLDYDGMFKELQERLEKSKIKKNEDHIKNEAKKNLEKILSQKNPQVKGIDLWKYYHSNYASSGYYGFFENKEPGCKFIFAFADIVQKGKGIPAIQVMPGLHDNLQKILSEKPDNPEMIITQLNKDLHGQLSLLECLIPFFYGELDLSSNELDYIYAHSPGGLPFTPFVVSSSGEIRDFKRSGDNVLGVTPEHTYVMRWIKIKKGDILCFFTDGVTKVKNFQDEEFGITRLKKAIRDIRDLKAEEIGERVIRELNRFAGGIENKEGIDITLLIIKYE